MEKLFRKCLDFFLDLKFMQSLKEKSNSKLIKKIYDKEAMIEIINYIFYGVVATVICVGSFAILIKCTPLGNTDFGENIANILSIVIATISAYIMNRLFVFKSKEANVLKEFSKFVAARVFSIGIDILVFFLLATVVRVNEFIVKIINQVIVTILNYIFSKKLIFVKKSLTKQ